MLPPGAVGSQSMQPIHSSLTSKSLVVLEVVTMLQAFSLQGCGAFKAMQEHPSHNLEQQLGLKGVYPNLYVKKGGHAE